MSVLYFIYQTVMTDTCNTLPRHPCSSAEITVPRGQSTQIGPLLVQELQFATSVHPSPSPEVMIIIQLCYYWNIVWTAPLQSVDHCWRRIAHYTFTYISTNNNLIGTYRIIISNQKKTHEKEIWSYLAREQHMPAKRKLLTTSPTSLCFCNTQATI